MTEPSTAEPAPDEGNSDGTKRGRAWLAPALAGVAGLVLGVVIGAAGEPEPEVVVETQTETVEVEVEVEPADLAERRAEMDARDAELDDREGALDAREAGLDELEEAIAAAREGLDVREAELDERAADLDQVEEERAAGTFPGNGTFLVGTDIEPGEYRTSGGAGRSCYWARLSGTSGDFDELIANGISDGPTVVTIRESDVAFETSGCNEWTRV